MSSTRKPADPTDLLPLVLPTLYKKSAAGGVVQWDISVWEEEGAAVIKTVWGTRGGKLQEAAEAITIGKKIGTRAETTPIGQAILEAKATWKKKLERGGYGTDMKAEQSAAKRSVSPMLALKYEDYASKLPKDVAMFIQPKLDGHRCIAHVSQGSVTLFSRKGEEITTMEHIKEDLRVILKEMTLQYDVVLIDGELFTTSTDFDGIASAVRGKKEKEGSAAARGAMQYHIYDVYVPSRPELVYSDRWAILSTELSVGAKRVTGREWSLCQVETLQLDNIANLDPFASDCVSRGYEGAMLRINQPYEPGKRSKTLLKVKTFIDAEFEVIDSQPGIGPYADKAVFTCLMESGEKFTVTSPGTHEEKRLYLADREKWIGKKLTVKYFGLTPDGIPRFPVAKCFRDDI
jgi:DNA ligase 1